MGREGVKVAGRMPCAVRGVLYKSGIICLFIFWEGGCAYCSSKAEVLPRVFFFAVFLNEVKVEKNTKEQIFLYI